MPSPPKPDLAAALSKLRERFLASVPDRIEVFAGLARAFEADDSDVAALESLRAELHRFHGTAGSYGFLAQGRLAALFELVVGGWLADPTRDRGRRAPIVERFTQMLAADFGEPGAARARRLLLVDLPDDQAARIAAEAFADGVAAERVGLLALAEQLEGDARAAVIAAIPAADLPTLGSRPFVHCAPDADPVAAFRGACGSRP